MVFLLDWTPLQFLKIPTILKKFPHIFIRSLPRGAEPPAKIDIRTCLPASVTPFFQGRIRLQR